LKEFTMVADRVEAARERDLRVVWVRRGREEEAMWEIAVRYIVGEILFVFSGPGDRLELLLN
jgi:hypothetical protein